MFVVNPIFHENKMVLAGSQNPNENENESENESENEMLGA